MATVRQVEFIGELLEQLGIEERHALQDADFEVDQVEKLEVWQASDLIEWLLEKAKECGR
ncbi:MAG: hypothetical protein GY906_11480 [bacterium]|nr:hypothetical protein [bacterium]